MKQKEKNNISNVGKIKKYLNKMFLDKSMAFAHNETINKNSELQKILIGEMMCISEFKRFIEYIESE